MRMGSWRVRWLGFSRMSFGRWDFRSAVTGPGFKRNADEHLTITPQQETLTDSPGIAVGVFEISRRPPL